jgi:uncharacterized protein (TIGR02996 family)
LEAALEQLAARVSVAPLPPAKAQQARFLAFMERARLQRPADVACLLADLEQVLPVAQVHFTATRLRALAVFPVDPRLGQFAAHALTRLPRWRHTHPRVAQALVALIERHPSVVMTADVSHALNAARALKVLRPAQRGLERQAAHPRVAQPAEPALLAALGELQAVRGGAQLAPLPLPRVASPGLTSAGDLLAAVWAAPADDGVRALAADRLQELGDPRGEFIALQELRAGGTVSAQAIKREKQLLTRHRDEWLGALAPFVVKTQVTFERGFPTRVRSKVNRVFKKKQIDAAPEWATVRRLEFDELAFFAPTMRALEEAVNVGSAGLEELATVTQPPPLRRLAVAPRPDDDGWLPVLARLPGLAALSTEAWAPALAFEAVEPFVAALRPHAPASLRELTLPLFNWREARGGFGWLERALQRLPPGVDRAIFPQLGGQPLFTFTRGPEGFTALEVGLGRGLTVPWADPTDAIVRLLRHYTPRRLSAVTLRWWVVPHEGLTLVFRLAAQEASAQVSVAEGA